MGHGWRDLWLGRLEGANHWIEPWLGHQRRDAYWKHGSVCEDYAAIEVPVYAVGGWVDGYTNAVPRMLEGLRRYHPTVAFALLPAIGEVDIILDAISGWLVNTMRD